MPDASQRRPSFGFEFFELIFQLEHFQIVHALEQSLHVVAAQIGHQHAERREMAGRVRNNNFPDRQFLRHRRGVQRPAAAVGDQRKVARIEAALEGHVTHRVGHRRGGDLQHARGGPLQIYRRAVAPIRSRNAFSAALRSKRISPPRKRSGESRPRMTLASVTVGSVPPRP